MITSILLVFLISLFIGVPIVTSMGLSSVLPLFINDSTMYSVESFIRWTLGGADNTTSIAIPMFILAGSIMTVGGISNRLFDVFALIVGKRTGGMPSAVVLTCMFFAAISGSGPATAAAIGSMCIPVLTNLGYDKKFVAALIATAAGLGVIIPPSIPFVLYGTVTNTSVGDLFIAGVLPGFLIGFLLIVYSVFYCKVKGEDKERIAEAYESLKSRGVINVLKESSWSLISPLIVLGGIYLGVFTPTEAAVISVFYSIFVSVYIYKGVKFTEIPIFLVEAIKSFAPILMLIAMATAFSRSLTMVNAPQILGEFIVNTFRTKELFILINIIVFFIIGMFMDAAPAIAVLAPMLMPTIVQFGINPVHYGVMLIVNLAIGQVTPPFGTNLFVISRLEEIPVLELGRKSVPFIIMFTIALFIISYVPWLALTLIK